MAKKKQKNPKVPNISEDKRIRITQILEMFRESSDEVFTFEPNLSKRDRAAVHLLCRKMGMKSKSTGRSKQRQVRVYKVRKKVTESQNLSNLSFSDEAKEVLRNLFTLYPPDDGEEGKEKDGKNNEKAYDLYQKRDGIFCKPLMSKAEIAKKLESLASRMENVLNLRQINEVRSKLPIASFRDVITSTVESHQVVLVSGETGCGKTTQVPQYLLDYMWGKGKACKIVCTQPRRISALSVAERISYERGQDIGDDVGYKIRLESKGGRHSSIVFCTNGVLLRVLIAKGAKAEVSKKHKKLDLCDMTHIIVDEIHERDRFSDFMLAILRDMLPSYPHLRLILMSATLDAERFSQYFGGCPIIRVPGFTYPVKTFYLEDVLSILRSPENNHLSNTILSIPSEESKLTEEDKLALDEAIDLAWSNDEFDPLLELVSSEATPGVFNYQHSSSGLTALMVFARKGRVGDVCMLLSFGADCQLRAKDGTTALEGAERDGQLETTEILKKHMESHFSNSMEEQQLLDKYFAEINPEFIDDVLIEQLLVKICTDSEDGAILVFLPGWDDIHKIRERLLMNPLFNNTSKFVIISLHSKVPSAEQKKAFKRPPYGCRKIVLSTNIAETAVTIDDVVYVIDTGRMKEKSYDPYNNVSTLQSSWVSKASAKQREGRAGRCQPGICYHLYSKLRAASFPEFQVPEIKRMPIEELCLQVKLLDPDCKIEDFLQKTMDPPIFESIRNAVVVLQDIGALSLDEKLTELGEKLGSLPVHPLTSKMLFFAILVNCLDPALTLACAADYRDPFTLPMLPNERKKAAAAKSELALLFGGHSDQLAVIAAFECWKNAKERGQEARFCSQYFVSSSTMQMLSGMRKQLQMELIRLGFISGDVSSYSFNASDSGILHAVLVAGLYPMVGRLLLPNKNMKRLVIETDSGDKVRLHHQSTISKLPFNKTDSHALVIFDEITRGDGGMNIRNCTLIGPLPLLLFSTEIAVAPTTNGDDDNEDDNNDDNDDDDDDDDGSDDNDEDGSDEDAMDMDNRSAEKHQEKIMSSPDNSVVVIVDRWLRFGSTALDVAQIYCLRERLAAAILFKVTHPREALPPLLAASAYAIALILSYDGMSGMYLPSESLDSKMSKVKDNEIDKSEGGKASPHHNSMAYLRSLLHRGKYENTHPHHVTARSQSQALSKDPLNYNGQGSVNQAYVNPHGMPLSGNLSFGGHGRGFNGRFVPGDSHKRHRGNGAGQR